MEAEQLLYYKFGQSNPGGRLVDGCRDGLVVRSAQQAQLKLVAEMLPTSWQLSDETLQTWEA